MPVTSYFFPVPSTPNLKYCETSFGNGYGGSCLASESVLLPRSCNKDEDGDLQQLRPPRRRRISGVSIMKAPVSISKSNVTSPEETFSGARPKESKRVSHNSCTFSKRASAVAF